MSINLQLDSLNKDQRELVLRTFDGGCAGCAVYLGDTTVGRHTYFWHYGASSGFVALPVKDENPFFDYVTGNINLRGREFTTDGEEIEPPPFVYLVHVDLRKWLVACGIIDQWKFDSQEAETSFLKAWGGGSTLPEEAALKNGCAPKDPVPWATNFWFKPWDVSRDALTCAVAVTLVYPDNSRVKVI